MPMDLTETKDDVLKRFNEIDYNGLMKVMHPDIILKRVLHHGSIVGIGNVKAYLLDYMAPLEPSFVNLTGVTFYPDPKADQAIDAHVSGKGDYYDEKGKPGTPVFFNWTFTKEVKEEKWLLINAFGAPLGPRILPPLK